MAVEGWLALLDRLAEPDARRQATICLAIDLCIDFYNKKKQTDDDE